MEYISELGNGTSGNVVKMRHKSSKKVIAVKVSGILERKAVAWQNPGRSVVAERKVKSLLEVNRNGRFLVELWNEGARDR